MTMPNSDFILRMLERLDEKMDDIVQKHAEYKAYFDVHARTDETLHLKIASETQAMQQILSEQSKHIAEYNHHLKEHMRRTELLENRVVPLEADLYNRKSKHGFILSHWKKISLVTAALSAAAAAIWTMIQIFSYLATLK